MKAPARIPRGRPCREHVPPPLRHANKANDTISLLMDIPSPTTGRSIRPSLLLTAPPCCGYRHALLLKPPRLPTLRPQRGGFPPSAAMPACHLAVGGFQLRGRPAGRFALHVHGAVVRLDLAAAAADPVPIRDAPPTQPASRPGPPPAPVTIAMRPPSIKAASSASPPLHSLTR